MQSRDESIPQNKVKIRLCHEDDSNARFYWKTNVEAGYRVEIDERGYLYILLDRDRSWRKT